VLKIDAQCSEQALKSLPFISYGTATRQRLQLSQAFSEVRLAAIMSVTNGKKLETLWIVR
jgi:hypothetical protein